MQAHEPARSVHRHQIEQYMAHLFQSRSRKPNPRWYLAKPRAHNPNSHYFKTEPKLDFRKHDAVLLVNDPGYTASISELLLRILCTFKVSRNVGQPNSSMVLHSYSCEHFYSMGTGMLFLFLSILNFSVPRSVTQSEFKYGNQLFSPSVSSS
jgi:hypothetical protein